MPVAAEELALEKLRRRLGRIDDLLGQEYDNAHLEEWRLTVSAILNAHFGPDHELAKRFSALRFQYVRMPVPVVVSSRATSDSPPPTRAQHNERYRSDLMSAKSVISAAIAVWAVIQHAPEKGASTLVQVNNSATSSSVATAHAAVEFPLKELLALVEGATDLAPAAKARAKESLEDLDGELRKSSPRWEKVRPALKTLLEAGKEIAIKTLAAVVAKMATGQ